MNKLFYVPVNFNITNFRKTKMLKKIGGFHFHSLGAAKTAQQQTKKMRYLISNIFAGNFKRQPLYSPELTAIFEVSMPDYVATTALATDSVCTNTKKYGKIFHQSIEPEWLQTIWYHLESDILHPSKEYTVTKNEGFMHGHIAEELDNRIIALERLAAAALRSAKPYLATIKWNDENTIQALQKVFASHNPYRLESKRASRRFVHNLLNNTGLETAFRWEVLQTWSNNTKTESKTEFTAECEAFLQSLLTESSEPEKELLQKFLDNLQQEVDNIWETPEPIYTGKLGLGRVILDIEEKVQVDTQGQAEEELDVLFFLDAFGTKTYLTTGDLREETLDITPYTELFFEKLEFARSIPGDEKYQMTLALLLTAVKMVSSKDKLTRHYARAVRNDMFDDAFKHYPEIVLRHAFHEKLYLKLLAQQLADNLDTEFRMRSSNAAIMLREEGVYGAKGVLTGVQTAIDAMKKRYPMENFADVQEELNRHVQYLSKKAP